MNAFRVDDELVVDAVVRVLLADGLSARRTGLDRLEVGRRDGVQMEWCCIGEMLFGRSVDDLGERAWVHTVKAGIGAAPFEIGRSIARVVRGLESRAMAS